MAQLLETWLNREVELSQRVSNFDEDFANGYLLGELLYKFNQQPDFESFANRTTRTHRLNNFTRLIPSFKALGIKFNTQMMDDVMQKRPGAASKLLYQLKMALEKTSAPVDVTLIRKDKLTEQPPVQKIRPPRQQFDDMEQRHFNLKLQALNRSQKEIDLENKLQKFKDHAVRAEENARRIRMDEEAQEQAIKEKKRKAQINKLQRNAGFMEDWDQKGIQDWNVNMETKKRRELMELTFKLKEAKNVKFKADKLYEQAVQESILGIAEFEANKKRFGIPVKPYKETQETPVVIPTTTVLSPVVLQGRDVRRRTMAGRLANSEKEKERNYRSEVALRKLDVLSPIEASVAQEIWNVTHYTELLIAHRKLRETRYERRREYDAELARLKEQKMLERWEDNMRLEISLEMERAEQLTVALNLEKRDKRDQAAEQILDLILDITEELYGLQQHKDHEDIDDRHWEEWLTLFKEGKSVHENDDFLLDSAQFDDYIQGLGQWASCPHNYYLGDAIQRLLNQIPFEKEKFKSDIPIPPIKLAVIGYPFSGKSTHIGRIKTRYDIEVINITELAEAASKAALEAGGVVTDQDLVNQCVERIKKAGQPG